MSSCKIYLHFIELFCVLVTVMSKKDRFLSDWKNDLFCCKGQKQQNKPFFQSDRSLSFLDISLTETTK